MKDEKTIHAPFNDEQVEKLNVFQHAGIFHPFTCCSPADIPECKRRKNEGDTIEDRQGVLTATNDGWVCPCGKYRQEWAHAFMAEDQLTGRPLFLLQVKVGDKVHFVSEDGAKKENGRIKEIPEEVPDSLRVVYNCADDWDNFQNYTSALTKKSQLRFGWV